MLNRTIMMGRLTADPELRKTQSGVSVCSFRIANDRDYVKDGEKETDFFDVVAWRSTAEFICKYFTKGRMIVLDGRFQNRERTNKEGQKWTANELVVDNAYFGDSKPADSGSAYGGDDAQYAPAYGGQYAGGFGAYNGPVAGAVPDGYCPDF